MLRKSALLKPEPASGARGIIFFQNSDLRRFRHLFAQRPADEQCRVYIAPASQARQYIPNVS